MRLSDEAGGLLGPGGGLAEALPDFEDRSQQVEMARAVADALEDGGRLVVEAGTGIGKTLAYLVPAALWALREGRRVVVATYTRNLQAQILKKDVPLLARALGREVPACLCVGGENYLCLRRLHRRLAHGDLGLSGDVAARFVSWVESTTAGLREEAGFAMPEAVWASVRRSPQTCAGRRCAFADECFYYRARARQDDSLILVANHALYFAHVNSPGALAEHAVAIFDEAHHLEEAATRFATEEASPGGLEELCRAMVGPDAGLSLLAEGDSHKETESLRHAVVALEDAFRDVTRKLAVALGGPKGRCRICAPSVSPAPVLKAVDSALALLSPFLKRASREEAEELELVAAGLRAWAGTVGRVLGVESRDYVYWGDFNDGAASLAMAPLEVAGWLRQKVYPGLEALVLTSATLACDGSLSFVKGRLGLEDAQELLLDSPFDYSAQALLYLPSRMPDPQEDYDSFVEAATEEVIRLVEARSCCSRRIA